MISLNVYEKKKKNKIGKSVIWTVSVLLVLSIAVGVYAADYYKADDIAASAMESAELHGKYSVFDGGGNIGLVFYPGGKVEHSAYAPLMEKLAESGISCILVKMPLNLAVLGSGAWRGAKELLPSVTSWYIGGHSLGGAMASSVADKGDFDGLILLGAYATGDVECSVLSIYGSCDGVMNRDKYDEALSYSCGGFTEYIIEGGNHAQFGSYGAQDGDGEVMITAEEQLAATVKQIMEFITK